MHDAAISPDPRIPGYLTRHANGAIVAVELRNSTTAVIRPRQTGGFFVPMFRGRRPCPGPRPKKRRPVRCRVSNPRSAVGLETRVAPVTADNGATGMSRSRNGSTISACPRSYELFVDGYNPALRDSASRAMAEGPKLELLTSGERT